MQLNTLAMAVSTVVTQLEEMVTMSGEHKASLTVDWSTDMDFGVVKESSYSRLKGGIE